MDDGHRDIYSLFLFSHSVVERWREGLLWSWAVGKLGGMHDEWLPADLERAWRDLGGQPGESVIEVMMTSRNTVQGDIVNSNLQAAGHVMSGKTSYAFGKSDGKDEHLNLMAIRCSEWRWLSVWLSQQLRRTSVAILCFIPTTSLHDRL